MFDMDFDAWNTIGSSPERKKPRGSRKRYSKSTPKYKLVKVQRKTSKRYSRTKSKLGELFKKKSIYDEKPKSKFKGFFKKKKSIYD